MHFPCDSQTSNGKEKISFIMHSCFKRRQHHYFHSTHNFEFYSVRVSNITLWNDRHQFWNVIRSSSIWVWQYSINIFFFSFWNKWKFFVFDWMTGICFAESSLQKFSHLSIHFKRFLHALGKDKFLKYLIPFKVFFLDFMSFCAHICQLGLCKSQRLKRVFVALRPPVCAVAVSEFDIII